MLIFVELYMFGNSKKIKKCGLNKLRERIFNEFVQSQVLLTRPVLRQCFVLPYVPLSVAGSGSVPVMNQFVENLFL